eukprot:2353632-Pleurochrysis_carterae.AAC.1
MDGYDLVDSPRPKPLAHICRSKADAAGTQDETPKSFSRIGLLVVGHGGLAADQKLAKKSIAVFFKDVAAVVC